MDDSVILLDDSQNSVQIVDDDVEDGELEDDVEFVPSEDVTQEEVEPAAEPEKTSTDNADQEANKECEENLVFEVRFHNEMHFASLQKQMLDVLEHTFSEKQLCFRSNPECLLIAAFEKSEVQTEQESSNSDHLFLIDTQPAVKLNAAQVPSYKRCNTDVLDEQTEARKKLKAEEVNKCFRPKAQSSCFNCGETDHSLRECPKPRNNTRIMRARKKNSHRMERYHVDAEQRFGHLRPGKISTKTRHAMGYNRGQLPFMFYRLRVLGYPPAWLEEAKVQSSGITLFNADGTEVTKSDDEDGESDTFKYDINKIVEFPGFNVHPGKIFDDFKYHNVPPFQEHQSKANFIKSLGESVINGYKRKKLVDLPAPHDQVPIPSEEQTSFGDYDMEIVDEAEDPPLPPSTPLPPPPPPEEVGGARQRSPSPSLDDLRAQQEKLLQQLECNTSLDTTANESTSQTDLDDTSEVAVKEVEQSLSAPATPFKASYEGTPLLKFSVYDRLPVGSNFKVGVSDVINFENLPDSTGKYEQMKGLLKNVREKMVKLQSEDN
ncbi:zinc finger CCHC domain-containing protein 8 homolog isoform X2 [Drosophila ficusphila]|uniref:zinc finger CCHC domain-containing protein 8 homolog isoform X2 n=1 Tax=Drosophila ficusphila TaxID=30025 RepID=UPI0007E665DB|nr:zinc finger CCHC domain-containing protein 8 homolog isoform X2 [Drosophila ficusphila]